MNESPFGGIVTGPSSGSDAFIIRYATPPGTGCPSGPTRAGDQIAFTSDSGRALVPPASNESTVELAVTESLQKNSCRCADGWSGCSPSS